MSVKILKFINIAIFLLMVILPLSVYAYDDETTHPAITKNALTQSIIHKYITENLGFKDGIKTLIPSDSNTSIELWLQQGSKLEDAPDCRAASHFLNPLKPWDEAGLSDTTETILGAFVVTPKCFTLTPFSDKYSIHKYSNVTWATGYTSPISGISDTDKDMDWNASRKYYKLALTTPDKNARENNFAKTFQSLGQVMHLVQDMTVPAHIRNDFDIRELLV